MTKLEIRFWAKVDIKSNTECWEFKKSLRNRYGLFWNGHKTISAHRFAWELHYKCKVPKGKIILHHCDNPRCVNHLHLYCGTPRDNMRDRTLRGRAIDVQRKAKQRRITA